MVTAPAPVLLGRTVLLRYLNVQAGTDAQIRALLRQTALEAERMIAALPGNYSGQVRAAQLRLAQQQAEMWGRVQGIIGAGAGNSAEAAAKLMGQFDAPYLRSIGIDPAAWRRSLIATARRGVEAYLARGVNGISLAERVYRNGSVASGLIGRIIDRGLILGKSAAEIAADVRHLINPATPGGVSYAAMRLARTELNNAFHRTAMEKYAATPWVDAVAWRLSGSHPRPDECDDYAQGQHMAGGGPGEYAPDDVPGKPHPHCLCYLEPLPMSPDAFVAGFLSGRFDDHLDRILPGAKAA